MEALFPFTLPIPISLPERLTGIDPEPSQDEQLQAAQEHGHVLPPFKAFFCLSSSEFLDR